MSDLTDRIALDLMQRYKLLWFDEDLQEYVEESDPSSLSVTLEVILGPEPWRQVLGFQAGEHPTVALVKSKTLGLKQQAKNDKRAETRIIVAFDAAMREILQEFGSS